MFRLVKFNFLKLILIIPGSVIFETKVSALFWAVFLEEPSVESMTALLPSAQYLYEEIMLTPYMARFVVCLFVSLFVTEMTQPKVLCKPHYGNSHLETGLCQWGAPH